MIPEKNNSLITTKKGLFCTKCNYYWVHGICKCEPILKVFCNCEKCKHISEIITVKGYAENGTYIKSIQIPDRKLVVTIIDKQKRKGFFRHKIPQRVMTFVGKDFSWKYLKSMEPVDFEFDMFLFHLYENINKYRRIKY